MTKGAISTRLAATPAFARAVATDAANASMRKRWPLAAWDDECLAEYHATFERVCRAGGFWIDPRDDPANVVALRRWNDLLSAGLTIDTVPEHLRHTFA